MEKILLAFPHSKDFDEIMKAFRAEFEKRGVQVDIAQISFWLDIEEFLMMNKDCDTLIVKEYLDGDNSINSQYLERLMHKFPKLKVTYIIGNKHYRSNYIKRIFNAEIYNCLFNKDASIENIVYICLNLRTKEEAESYYGLMDSSKASEKVQENIIKSAIGFKKRNEKKNDRVGNVRIKEKIIYRVPKDYQKIIGIYSPYSVGKTVMAVNLSKCYCNKKLEVTLIDTDHFKKDVLYYFPLDNNDFFKLNKFYNDIKMKKEIADANSYAIEIGRRLKLFTDHRDSNYEITLEMINYIVRSSASNLIIIDIASHLDTELVNEILAVCDERVIIADKMISTLNGLPYKLILNKINRRNLSLVINRDVNIKNLSNNKLKNYFKDIECSEREKFSLDFDNIFFVPNKFELIAESMANRELAYNKDGEFDESIMKIANTLYQVSMTSKEDGIKGLFRKLFI